MSTAKKPVFWHADVRAPSQPIRLSRDEAHHAFHVARLKAGDACRLIDDAGHEAEGIVQPDRTIAVADLKISERPYGLIHWMIPRLLPEDLKIIAAHAATIGVARVLIVSIERTQGYAMDKAKLEAKLIKSARAAQKLAGLPFMPSFEFGDMSAFLDRHCRDGGGPVYVFHEEAHVRAPIAPSSQDTRGAAVMMCFGPEGGFTAADMDIFAPYQPVMLSLGPVNFPIIHATLAATMFWLGKTQSPAEFAGS